MDDLVNNLLKLHCVDCEGESYGCTGCTKEQEIKLLLQAYKDSQKCGNSKGNKCMSVLSNGEIKCNGSDEEKDRCIFWAEMEQ